MFKFGWKRLGLVAGLTLSLVAAGCGTSDDASTEEAPSDSEDSNNVEEVEEVEAVDYGAELGYKITGIEPGAGIMKASEAALEEYGLDGWEVLTSSSGAMATALGEAIKNEEPIIVTGWSPHWKFSEYDLKYLDDPKEVFGGEESIFTFVREGLEDDKPEAFEVLENFNWTPEVFEAVMLEINHGASPEEAAANFVEANADMVEEWTDGVDEVSGDSVELAYVEWDTEIASTNVMKLVLESVGYDVTITPLDNAVMWQAVATGEADGMIAAWLPGTHADLYEEHKDNLVDLGPNMEGGAKIGLVVPAYMEIDSIEDLQPAN